MTQHITWEKHRAHFTATGSALDRWCRQILINAAERIADGRITLRENDSLWTFGAPTDRALTAEITVQRPRFYRRVVFGGSIGAAESYMDGDWLCDDLSALSRIFVRNHTALESLDGAWARASSLVHGRLDRLRPNTRKGSRRNIAAHYDLGNELFERFLDPTLTYSSGIFERADATMEEASIAKLDRLCRKLHLGPKDHVVEIGTGWGSFALHAAQRYGCRVTTTTISAKQHKYARNRVREAGLADRVSVLDQDYRDLTGAYDKLVSIEMIEAVGDQFFDTFFAACSRLLKPSGAMALQAITIADQQFDRYRKSVDFIRRYIFPGGCLPSVTAMMTSVARASDLRLTHLEDLTPHYATTLRHWRRRFDDNLESVRQLGYSDAFCRMWEFYLAFCEGGFAERNTGVVQMHFAKPANRDPVAMADEAD